MVRTKIAVTVAVASVAFTAIALPVAAKMSSTKVEAGLCLTEGGGRFVDIPGFAGERIDRRLLRDIKVLKRKYKIFVTDGYSDDPVHSANGEHPIGLALDIVPDKSKGGTWADIDALAAWAEPRQNHPISPFRWVGYDGDANHGRGHHLHLSWEHSDAKFGQTGRERLHPAMPQAQTRARRPARPIRAAGQPRTSRTSPTSPIRRAAAPSRAKPRRRDPRAAPCRNSPQSPPSTTESTADPL